MSYFDLAKRRYSVRNYQKKSVEKEKLETLLDVAWVAPTAGNQQPVRLLIVNTEDGLAKLSKGVTAHGAPLAIIVCADKNVSWVRPFDKHSMADIDAALVTDQMMMCAEDIGLSTCWLTYFNPNVIREEFNIPSNLIPVSILAIGYSADSKPLSPERHKQTRNDISSMITYGTF